MRKRERDTERYLDLERERERERAVGVYFFIIFLLIFFISICVMCFFLPVAVINKLFERKRERERETYNEAIVWLRTRLSFALLRSSLMCIRGSRPHRSRRVDLNAVPVAISETRI